MITPSTVDRDLTRRRKTLDITLTPSGNYVNGGDTVNLTTTANPKMIPGGKPATLPKSAIVLNAPAGYTAEFIIGASLATCLLKINASDGTQLAAGAYPAALVADPFIARLSGPLGNF